MEIADVHRRFAAYASGSVTEVELRNVIRSSLLEQPSLSEAYLAMTEAYRCANVIDAELQSDIVADITEITGPPGAPQDAPPSRSPTDTLFADASFAGRTDFRGSRAVPPASQTTGGLTKIAATGPGSVPGRTGTGSVTGRRTGTTTGSNWDMPEWTVQPAAPLFPGAVLNDHYVLLEELGRGGMGIVYKALDRRAAELNDRHCYVAIKILGEDFKRHPLAIRALQRETRKAQTLAHPNILTVHCFDRDGGNAFMVMELLAGHSLDQLLRTEGKAGLPLRRSIGIVKALGAALEYAHERGIIHSDLKPSNIFVTEEGAVKVLDFGIARAAPSVAALGDQHLTMFDAGQLGAVCPAYASIEMLNGEAPDVRDDVFALAMVTYELLTGRHPFNRIDAAKARQAGLQPRRVWGLSRAQWRALKQGLAYERKARTPSVHRFVASFVAPRTARRVWVAVAASLALAAAIGTTLIFTGLWRPPEDVPERISAGLHGMENDWRISAANRHLDALNPANPGYLDAVLERRDDLHALETLSPSSPTRTRVLYWAQRVASQQLEDRLSDSDLPGAQQLLRQAAQLLPESDLTAMRNKVLLAEKNKLEGDAAQQRLAETPAQQGSAEPAGTASASPGTPNGATGETQPATAGQTLPAIEQALPATAEQTRLARAEPSQPTAGQQPGVAVPGPASGSAEIAQQPGATTEHERQSSRAGTANPQQQVQVDILKSTLADQVAAGDIAGAGATAAELRRRMGGGAYVAHDLPQALVDAYLHRARAQFAAGDVDGALQTLATSRKKFGREARLKDLETRYVAVGDIYDRLRSAVSLNASDQRSELESLRATEGDEYSVAAQMLARTLANRIADEQAANRPSVAANLLLAGRQIFPDNAKLLEQGTAGALPNDLPTASEASAPSGDNRGAPSSEQSAQQTSTPSVQQSPERPVQQASDQPAQQAPERSTRQSAEQPAQQPAEPPAQQSSDQSVQQQSDKPAQNPPPETTQ
jgi:serine/threonine protein kinase